MTNGRADTHDADAVLDTIRYGHDGRPLYYILAKDGRTPIPATMRAANALLGDYAARTVGATFLGRAGHVSTVFLALDHGLLDDRPVLFETLVFGGRMDGYMLRHTSWAKANFYHRHVVNLLCRTLPPMAKRLRGHYLLGHRYDRGSNSAR